MLPGVLPEGSLNPVSKVPAMSGLESGLQGMEPETRAVLATKTIFIFRLRIPPPLRQHHHTFVSSYLSARTRRPAVPASPWACRSASMCRSTPPSTAVRLRPNRKCSSSRSSCPSSSTLYVLLTSWRMRTHVGHARVQAPAAGGGDILGEAGGVVESLVSGVVEGVHAELCLSLGERAPETSELADRPRRSSPFPMPA